jgi:hypothetical protein
MMRAEIPNNTGTIGTKTRARPGQRFAERLRVAAKRYTILGK